MIMNSLDFGVAKYVVEGTFDRLSTAAIDVAKAAMLDTIGVTVAGSREPSARIVADYVRAKGGRPISNVLGQGFLASPEDAALANGTAAHALDFDDSHHPAMIHPSAVLMPTLLAVGQSKGSTGPELLTAYLYSLDVLTALATHLNPDHYQAGWHATSTTGVLGAALGAAKLADLSVEQTQNALSLAASHSHGLRINFGSMCKGLHAGSAASAGVLSALLAERGFTATSGAIGGKSGLFSIYDGVEAPDFDDVMSQLDHSLERAVGGLSLKRFPSCGVTQAPVEAALEIAGRGPISAEDILSVECHIQPFIRNILTPDRASCASEARFSIQHCVAVALLDGEVGLEQFSDTRVVAPDVSSLFDRITLVDDVESAIMADSERKLDMVWPSSLVVRFVDGRQLTASVRRPMGRAFGQIMPKADVIDKFMDCMASAGVQATQARQCSDLIDGLEEVTRIGAITDLDGMR